MEREFLFNESYTVFHMTGGNLLMNTFLWTKCFRIVLCVLVCSLFMFGRLPKMNCLRTHVTCLNTTVPAWRVLCTFCIVLCFRYGDTLRNDWKDDRPSSKYVFPYLLEIRIAHRYSGTSLSIYCQKPVSNRFLVFFKSIIPTYYFFSTYSDSLLR